ncbi:MAG: flagellar export chaperone FliS [Planctomycetes bacterium]|nr:flagellar export chaperone FliS [Planctomycetota bacterium]
MSLAQAKRAYGGNRVMTGTALDLVVLLYERAILDVQRAQQAASEGKWYESNAELGHARQIVLELLSSLDRERGGEVAANLASLYVFCASRLVPPAHAEGVQAAREVLDELLAGYRELRSGRGGV